MFTKNKIVSLVHNKYSILGIILILLLGSFFLGRLVFPDVEGSSVYQTQTEELEKISANFKSLRMEKSQIEASLEQYEERESLLEEREQQVQSREVAVTTREEEVSSREDAVTILEEEVDASRIEPGTYLITEELGPGRYRVVNDLQGRMCYMSQDNGSDIINNLLEEAGRPVFTVVDIPGTTFTIDSDCGVVEKLP